MRFLRRASSGQRMKEVVVFSQGALAICTNSQYMVLEVVLNTIYRVAAAYIEVRYPIMK